MRVYQTRTEALEGLGLSHSCTDVGDVLRLINEDLIVTTSCRKRIAKELDMRYDTISSVLSRLRNKGCNIPCMARSGVDIASYPHPR